MRTTILSLALALPLALFLAPVAPAADVNAFSASGGGFQGPGPGTMTVAEASRLRDDAQVVLRGSITSHLGGDNYVFQDSTGTINVDIDDRKWAGQTVTPENVVEISGEIDRDWNSLQVDADSIKVIQ